MFQFTSEMAQYWLSSCELGKMMLGLADIMASPEVRSHNYTLHVVNTPIKSNTAKALQEVDPEKRKSYFLSGVSLEDVIKVSKIRC